MSNEQAALKALHDAVQARFDAEPELNIQMFWSARVNTSGAKASGAKAEGLAHLADGEVCRNTAEVKPIASLLNKAITELGFDKKRTNAALFAQRLESGVVVRILTVSPGDAEKGEVQQVDARNMDNFYKGADREWYFFPLPVGHRFDVAADGTYQSEKEVGFELWGAPIPWGTSEIDKNIYRQFEEALRFDPPMNHTIRAVGTPVEPA